MRINRVCPVFVEFIPEHLESGKLYISNEYGVIVHLCCCGCGEKVVTPLSPVDWSYINSSKGVSLSPSIGNWDYVCQSHYFINDNRVIWVGGMSKLQIEKVKKRDYEDKLAYIAERNSANTAPWIIMFAVSIFNKVKNFFIKNDIT
ncbi:DUF6527 family protein [Shewanella sedimentimangrovi]|uniref:Uncharacterized protein n=1 Tax=Shewanella sedimentimangrovi TaxID=2814293 RepID=A0ABX7R3W6_9GAMM|nr:DUF6527 family protein [Shewanella sedimentimangrovi]QSX37798.1 hypothetical protein JYB85_02845 [Shewanella sedimentimangrovi]